MKYLILLLLAGCATQISQAPQAATVTTTVRFVPWSQVDAECRAAGATARTSIYGCATTQPPHWIIAPQPASMADDKALCVLGHEFGHNLGGLH